MSQAGGESDFVAGLRLALFNWKNGVVSPSEVLAKFLKNKSLTALEIKTFSILNTVVCLDSVPLYHVAWWEGGVFTVSEIQGENSALIGWDNYVNLIQEEEEILQSFNAVMVKEGKI